MRTATELLLLNLMLFLVRCVRYVHEATLRRVLFDALMLALFVGACLYGVRTIVKIIADIVRLAGGLG
jgi:hypothetical protein